MSTAGIVLVDIQARLDKLEQDIERSIKGATDRAAKAMESRLSKVGDSMKRIGDKMSIAVTAPIAAFGVSAFNAASDLSESLSKVNVVFGQQSQAIEAWAGTAAEAFGQSKQQALEAAGTYGNLFSAMGIATDTSAQMSMSLVELAGDLASFNNASPEDTLLALRSGLSGETEPLKRFGVNLTAARIEAEALALGLAKEGEELDAAAKAQAVYSLILKDTTLAQGDFARTADGAANQQRILAAQFADMRAELGQKLLPIGQKLIRWAAKVVDWFSKLSPGMQDMVLMSAGLAAAMGPLLSIGGRLIGVIKGISGAISFLGANPYILAIAAIAAIAILIYQNWETLYEYLRPVYEWLGGMAAGIGSAFQTVGNAIVSAFNTVKAVVQSIIDWLRGAWDTASSFVTSIPGAGLVGDFANWIQGRADGGPVRANTPYWVGEQGIPELFVPKTSGVIVPMRDLAAAGTAQGDGMTINVYNPVAEPTSVTVARERRRGGYISGRPV